MSDQTQQLQQHQRPAHHPVLISHFVLGVAFLGLLTVWALVVGDVVEGADIRFLLPAPWVLAGVAGLVALIASDRRRHAPRETEWVDTVPSASPSANPSANPSARLDE